LAEFIAEWTPTPDEEIPETILPGREAPQEWVMYFDGAFSLQGTRAGMLLVTPIREHLKYVIQMHFVGFGAPQNPCKFELWGACEELNFPRLPTRRP
jgi:hypothetical protein